MAMAADRGERSFIEADFVRHLDDQVARNRNDLRVRRIADAGAGDAIPDFNVVHRGFDDDAGSSYIQGP